MQATKQHSSAGKKSAPKANSSKSIAQRVMDVASSQKVPAPEANQTNGPTNNFKASSLNSIENDAEVEDITNRVARLDADELPAANQGAAGESAASGAGQQTSDANNNCTNKSQSATKAADQSGSPSLLLDADTVTPAGQVSTSGSFNSNSTAASIVNGGSIFRQAASAKSKPELLSPLQSAKETPASEGLQPKVNGISASSTPSISTIVEHKSEARISLDTKVPHPSKFEFSQQDTKEREEVGYYNAQLLDCPRMSNSMDSSKSHRNIRLSVIVPRQHYFTSQGDVKKSTKAARCSREYTNDPEPEDDYDTRYDTAMVDDDDDHHHHNHLDGADQSAAAYQNELHDSQPEITSIPNSPKAKSAPATPCNVTPVAFHQNTSHLNAMLHPSPANTLPPDIRKNISATCRVVPSSMGAAGHVSAQYLDGLIKRGESSLDNKDYEAAIWSFSQCIELAAQSHTKDLSYLRRNFKVYGQRAEAHLNLGNYNEAIEDSMAARELNPKWNQAYYLQGRAQFLIGQYADALAVFSFGLAQDRTDRRLFDALVDAALNSTYRREFEAAKLRSFEAESKQFVVVAIVGQVLLAKSHSEHAAIILESALKLGPENKKFKGSVLSSIGHAYCLMRNYDKAAAYMQKELELEEELEDVSSQCRILSNLGFTYYKMRKFDKSLEAHRKQLKLAMRAELWPQASTALDAVGHVHVARNDFTSALTSHTRSLEILKQLGDNDYDQIKQLLSMGHMHCMLNDFKSAQERYNEAIQLIDLRKISQEEHNYGLIMVNFNLAYLALKKQSFPEAEQYYELVIHQAARFKSPKKELFEMRAANGLGHTYRLSKKFEEARLWFQRQLKSAESLNDRVGRSQALCNLGMICQHFKDYESARRLFDDNMRLVDEDPLLRAYGHSYVGSMFFLMARYSEAQAHYKSSMNLFEDLDYCAAERKTMDLNMASVNERMGHIELNPTTLTQQKKVMMA